MKQRAIICDLDGTLCETSHREHYLKKTPKDWESFFSKLRFDPINEWCLHLISSVRLMGTDVLFVTGRDRTLELETVRWLKGHNLFLAMSDLRLFMRNSGDRRPDTLVKKDIYIREIRPYYDVLFAIEDRNTVVEMWRRDLGLTCLQCKEGDY